jgi:transcription antitermination factor NusG
MRELKGLLLSTQDENTVSRDQIEAAINKGDNKTHRLGLFKEELGRIKTTGTDEVIVQLKEALKKTPKYH